MGTPAKRVHGPVILVLPLALLTYGCARTDAGRDSAGPATDNAAIDTSLIPPTPSAYTPPAHLPSGVNARDLRVCADPNNMPFSNSRGEGLENALAEIIASDLDKKVAYTWVPQRRGFVRNSLRSGSCDVVMGVPYSFELTSPTRPYYRSTYVFATRSDRNLRLTSLDDPQLRSLTIGVHLVGDDYANAPPAHALGNRGIVQNVRGYPLYGDYSKPNPPMRLVEAVVNGDVDVAIVWGPFAGWAKARGEPLALTPVTPQIDAPFLPFVYDISIGMRRGDDSLRILMDAALRRRQPEITQLLRKFGIPLVASSQRAEQ